MALERHQSERSELYPRLHIRAYKHEDRGGACAQGLVCGSSRIDHGGARHDALQESYRLRAGAAPFLLEPSPGVATTGSVRGPQVEELADRFRHARTAFPIAMEC